MPSAAMFTSVFTSKLNCFHKCMGHGALLLEHCLLFPEW